MHTWAVFGNDAVDGLSGHAVDDIVTRPGNEMAVGENVYIILAQASASRSWISVDMVQDVPYVSGV